MKLYKLISFLFFGLWVALFAGCTTTSAPSETATDMTGNVVDVSSGFVSSSSPDSIFEDSAKVEEFVFKNFARVKFDIAVGAGEYVSALGLLLHIPSERESEFLCFAKKRYSLLFPSESTTSAEMIASLNQELDLSFYKTVKTSMASTQL